jgi:hypothetical protein
MSVLATVFTVILILSRVVEHLVLGFIDKKKKTNPTYLDNASETRQKIKESHTICTKMWDIISRVDESGAPMVYFPKTIVNSILENNRETIRFNQQLVEKMVEISASQKHIAEALIRLDNKLDRIKEI